jgi:hypothetical protein
VELVKDAWYSWTAMSKNTAELYLSLVSKLSPGSAPRTGALPLISRPNSSILPVALVHYSRSKYSRILSISFIHKDHKARSKYRLSCIVSTGSRT